MDVSVVIPSYNAERYLEECIESVLAQNLKAKEIVVVDDGSKDKTAEIAQAHPINIRGLKAANILSWIMGQKPL